MAGVKRAERCTTCATGTQAHAYVQCRRRRGRYSFRYQRSCSDALCPHTRTKSVGPGSRHRGRPKRQTQEADTRIQAPRSRCTEQPRHLRNPRKAAENARGIAASACLSHIHRFSSSPLVKAPAAPSPAHNARTTHTHTEQRHQTTTRRT